jgi:hypothetical protein
MRRYGLGPSIFVAGERQIALPAFGESVGGSLITSGEGEKPLTATARGVFDVTRGDEGRYSEAFDLSERKHFVKPGVTVARNDRLRRAGLTKVRFRLSIDEAGVSGWTRAKRSRDARARSQQVSQ